MTETTSTVNESVAAEDRLPDVDPGKLPLWRLVQEIIRVSNFRFRVGLNIIALKITSLLFEGIGFAMLLPIMEYIGAGRDINALVEKSNLWRKLVDYADVFGLPVNLAMMFVVSVVCIFFRQIFQYIEVAYQARKMLDLTRHVQIKGFRKALAAKLGHHDKSVSGDLINDLVSEVAAANSCIFSIIAVIGVVIQLVAYYAALVAMSLWLSLSLLGAICILAVVLRGMMRQSREVSQEITRINQSFVSFLIERMRSMRLIRLSGMEKAEVSELNHLISNLNNRSYIIRMIRQRIPVIFEPLTVIMVFALMYVSIDILNMRIELVLIFSATAMRTLPLMQQLVQSYQSLLSITGSMRTIINRIHALGHHRESDSGQRKFTGLQKSIRFENVFYDHGVGDEVPALNGVSLEIPDGKITGLVGPSGSGKSTLIDLLPRLRDPDCGAVTFDGVSGKEFTLSSLRASIGFVPQKPQTFNVSIRDHICYGNATIGDDDIIKAARLAGAADFIEALTKGYDTVLGESGIRLSGGQLQRVDLARALARNCSILILDEPASGLDADAEEQFLEALKRIHEETAITVLLIAHGFSTVVDADQIIVLKDGQVEASGTHESLMKMDGWYAQAFRKQHRAALRLDEANVGR